MSMVVPPNPNENQRPEEMQARGRMDRERIAREYNSSNLMWLVPYILGLVAFLVVAAVVRLLVL